MAGGFFGGYVNTSARQFNIVKISQRVALLSASCFALSLATSFDLHAQTAQQAPAVQSGAPNLPAVQVNEPDRKRTRRRARRANTAASSAARTQASDREPDQKPKDTHDARTGTVGYFVNSTSVATKTNTPLINIPQSITVLPKEFIDDQNTHSITDITRYIPGVAVHQGEGNRDELVIRGVDSSANFFVNGFRDDVQYFRDLYNVQSVEVLKGPSAMTFGRGAGGGLVNRTLKEADGQRIYETSVQGGSWGDRRVTLDAGQAVTENVAVRLNAFYEKSDTFRDYGWLERYGVNPTVTLKPTEDTKIKLSYEYYYDNELADRGNPAIGTTPAPTRFNPTSPFAPNGDYSKFFGSPIYNNTYAHVQTAMAVIEHDFNNGLTVKNSTLYADYNRAYTNVYPGSMVDPLTKTYTLSAYRNMTNRENLFNQTDFTYKVHTGPIFHTFAFGTEFGRQTGLSKRDSGQFVDNTINPTNISDPIDAFNPTYFGTLTFNHQASDNFGKYQVNIASAYAQDQIDLTHWLQLFAGVRFDSFSLDTTSFNAPVTSRSRTDDKVSPRLAVILKPADNLSFYGAYSISYLPASGDQFSSLNNSTLTFEPQKFENKEIGLKWNINPRLLYTAAVYDLTRSNVPIADPNNPGQTIAQGNHKIRGFETALTGYITSRWQATLGYAYTDARIMSDVSATVVAGNRVQLVPYNQVSLWNKYQIDPVWSAAVGMIYFSDSYATSDDTVKLPGFVRFDAGLYAKINQTWRAQLNVENIFNKGYWASADANNNLTPGQSRTFRVKLIANF